MFGAAPTGVARPPTEAANVVISNSPVAYERLASGRLAAADRTR